VSGMVAAPSRKPIMALTIVSAMRPAQWLKNGVILAGLVFGGKLLDPVAVRNAALAVGLFCLLSGGFYLINDVRDRESDRRHPAKRLRPVAAGELSEPVAFGVGVVLIVLANAGAIVLGYGFMAAVAAYTLLMASYNLGLKDAVIVDVLAIAGGFVLRAAAGAVAVDVSISPWLLTCTMLLALLISFGKRRNELVSLGATPAHRRTLEMYSQPLLDQAVAVTAAGTLIAYAVYTIDADSGPPDHRMMVTAPIVAYGIFRYLYLIYRRGEGGAPEWMLLTDRGLLAAVLAWGLVSAALFYFRL
jgi:4-hydroxybenzoate polyprenyltransferase